MHTIDKGAGQVVASDTQISIAAVEHAVMSLANLCASIVEVSQASRLPVSTAQMALTNAGKSLENLIASRGNISHATAEMAAVQNGSNLRTVAFGCPGGLPDTGSASASDTATPVTAHAA